MPPRAAQFQRRASAASRHVSGRASDAHPKRRLRPRLCPCPPAADARALPASRRRTDDARESAVPARCAARTIPRLPAACGIPRPCFSRKPASSTSAFPGWSTPFPARPSSEYVSAGPRVGLHRRPPVPRLRNISATRCPQDLHAAFPRRSSAKLRADLGAHSRRPSPPAHGSVSRAGSAVSPRFALPCSPHSIPHSFSCAFPALLPNSASPFCASFVKNRYNFRTRCATYLQRRASPPPAFRPTPQLRRNVSRRSQCANIKQHLLSRRDCDHAFVSVRSLFTIPQSRTRQRFLPDFFCQEALFCDLNHSYFSSGTLYRKRRVFS